MRSLAYFDIVVGVRSGPLNISYYTSLYFKIAPLYYYYSMVGIQLLTNKVAIQVNTNLLFSNVLVFRVFKGLNKQLIHKSFLFCYYKFLTLIVQSLLIYNDLMNQVQRYQVSGL
jgi:hypothetical protein